MPINKMLYLAFLLFLATGLLVIVEILPLNNGKSLVDIQNIQTQLPLTEKQKGEVLEKYNKSGAEAMILAADNKILLSAGALETKINTGKMTPAFLNSLYGIAVEKGLIDIQNTLGQLAIDDKIALTDIEKTATLTMLLKGRSGVYLPLEPENEKKVPARGKKAPDTMFYYNPWDINVLAYVLQEKTGMDIGMLFNEWIAKPLGMKSFNPEDVQVFTSETSIYPSYEFLVTAEDLSLFAQLYANLGKVQNQQILSVSWIQESFTQYSHNSFDKGYGYLWWTDFLYNTAWARNDNGQYMLVDPNKSYSLILLNENKDQAVNIKFATEILSAMKIK